MLPADSDILRRFRPVRLPAHFGDAGFLQVKVDEVRSQDLRFSQPIKGLQQPTRSPGGLRVAFYRKQVATTEDGHGQPGFYLFEMAIELAA